MSDFVKVATMDEIPTDTGKKVEIDGVEIALYQCEGQVYAISNVCPHAGGPMSQGGIHGELAMCPWHGWEFNVKTGLCDFNPQFKLSTFEVKVDGKDVYVKGK